MDRYAAKSTAFDLKNACDCFWGVSSGKFAVIIIGSFKIIPNGYRGVTFATCTMAYHSMSRKCSSLWPE
jgi:hypothetical protein